ncbi:hypothetical protein EJB05_22569 [Eragrostis curvula]|uniref:Uncharacterized protein n=1 Tax=Eragrostis curvula TaxID=38414 RepID=A0A5J9V4S7_9POAL|nr:hypothetical protein EJB05_22569 [Eragrostis curvula]
MPLTHVCARPAQAMMMSAFPISQRVIDDADLNVDTQPVVLLLEVPLADSLKFGTLFPAPRQSLSRGNLCQHQLHISVMKITKELSHICSEATGTRIQSPACCHCIQRDAYQIFATRSISVELPSLSSSHKDRFVERQPRTTAQSTELIMVDLVKYYAVFPVLPAFMERGRKGYFQTQVMEGYS